MATSIFKEYFRGYEILGELGRGNARVLKARNLQTGLLVAIKHFAFNTEPDTLRRFQRESEIMKSIQHDYVVKIIEVHLDAELPYIVMELIDGGDLRSLLKNYGTLDIAMVIRLARHMTEALDTIHAKAIVHRDVKPENIMYRGMENGAFQFLLTDFGIARLREQTDAITITGASMLTYDYASPEQFNQSKTVAAPTDYYSLGVVLYECLTGSVPFEYEQDDLLMHINRVISCPLPVPVIPLRADPPDGAVRQSLPPSLLQLLEGLMRKQPSLRVSDPVSVHHLLKMTEMELRDGVQVMPSADSRRTLKGPVPVASFAKKKRRAPFTLVLVLIAIAIFFSWTNLVKKQNKIASTSIPATGTLPLIETRHVLPPETAHIVHARLTPAVITGNLTTPLVDPGVALVNGMYYNDFDQQDSLWETGRDENSEFILLDGKYTMRGFRDTLSYSSAIKLKLDTEKDFTVAATAVHQGESAGDPYGIIFCGDEAQDAFFVFYITSNGYYSIGTSVRDQWNVLTDWTASSSLRQDAEMNIFSIERRGGVLRFLINDKLEKIIPFTGSYGSYFGLRVDGTQTISFDQFIVKGYSPINNPL
jgi:eukaryotic-like serine/threonine-protein kinase